MAPSLAFVLLFFSSFLLAFPSGEGANAFPMGKGRPEGYAEMFLSLSSLLEKLVEKHLRECSLVLAVDSGFRHSVVLERILRLRNVKQVLDVASADDFGNILWETSLCRGYLFLLEDSGPLLEFLNFGEDPWDYEGKHIFVASKENFEKITNSKKGLKTDHLLGLVEATPPLHYNLYMNLLYWGQGIELVNRWTNGTFSSSAELFPNKVSNLRGATIKVINFEFAPHVLHNEDGNKYGRDVQVIYALAERLNFTVVFREPPKGELWGTKLSNGTWTGLVGALVRNEGQLGVANVFISDNSRRSLVQDFSQPYDADMSCFMTRTVAPLPRWQSPALPFTFKVWMLVLGGLLFTAPILHLLAKGGRGSHEITGLQEFTSTALYTWGIQLREPQAHLPVRGSTRILVAFLCVSCVILTIGYASNLTAFLTISRMPAGVETFSQLVEHDYDVMGIGLFFKISLASSMNRFLKELSERYVSHTDFDNALSPVRKGKSVFIQSRKYLEYLISNKFTSRGVPTMKIMKECFAPFSVGVALQRHSPLKKSLDLALNRMVEGGLVGRWFSDALWRSRKNTRLEGQLEEGREDKTSSHVIPLSIDHLQGIFFILFVGSLLSVFVFVFEVLRGRTH